MSCPPIINYFNTSDQGTFPNNLETSIRNELLPCGKLCGISVIMICLEVSLSSTNTSILSNPSNLLNLFTIAINDFPNN